MAIVTVAGEGLIGGTLCLPRVGAWHLDATIDSATTLSGAVKVQIGDDLELSGFIFAGAPYTETGYYRIVGGAGASGRRRRRRPTGSASCAAR